MKFPLNAVSIVLMVTGTALPGMVLGGGSLGGFAVGLQAFADCVHVLRERDRTGLQEKVENRAGG